MLGEVPSLVALFMSIMSFVVGVWVRHLCKGWFNELSMTQIAGQKWKRFVEYFVEKVAEKQDNQLLQKKEVEIPIPKTVWKKLIRLTHPDKHRGSELSTEVTVWLNAHRPRGS